MVEMGRNNSVALHQAIAMKRIIAGGKDARSDMGRLDVVLCFEDFNGANRLPDLRALVDNEKQVAVLKGIGDHRHRVAQAKAVGQVLETMQIVRAQFVPPWQIH